METMGHVIGARDAQRTGDNNVLIRRDLRKLNAEWRRRPFVWLLLIGAIPFWLACIYLGASRFKGPEWLQFYAFTAFHLFLHIFIPFNSFRIARRAVDSGQIDSLRVSPIGERAIFGWLWLRGFGYLGGVLAFYFPLYFVYAWLYGIGGNASYLEWGYLRTQPGKISWQILLPFEFVLDAIFIALILAPWMRRRVAVATFCVAGLVLFCLPLVDVFLDGEISETIIAGIYGATEERASSLVFIASYAHFHPAVTLLYFFSTAAFGAALGTFAGLRFARDPMRGLLRVAMLGPVAELGVLSMVFGEFWTDRLLNAWVTLYYMLMFYILSLGAFWMGLKWNLLFYFSRRPLLGEPRSHI